MKWLIWILAVFVLLVLNTGVFSQIYFLPILPGMLVVFGAVILTLEDQRDWLIITAISGVMMDFASGLPDGVMLLSLFCASGMVYILTNWLITREYGWITLFATSAVMSTLFFLLVLGFAKIFDLVAFDVSIDYAYFFTRKILWYIVINLILTYPVYIYYLLIKRLISKIQKRPHESI
jgi:hypothetical protein